MPCSSLSEFPQARERWSEPRSRIDCLRLPFPDAELPLREPIHEVACNIGYELECGFRHDRIAAWHDILNNGRAGLRFDG